MNNLNKNKTTRGEEREEAPNNIGGEEEGRREDRSGVEELRVASVEVIRFPFPPLPTAEKEKGGDEAKTIRPRNKAGPLSSKTAGGSAKRERKGGRGRSKGRAIYPTTGSPPPLPATTGSAASTEGEATAASSSRFREESPETTTGARSDSGAMKRGRSGGREAPIKKKSLRKKRERAAPPPFIVTTDEDDPVVVVDDPEEVTEPVEEGDEPLEPLNSKGRGRPATTGQGVLSRETKAARDRLAGLEKQIRLREQILRGDYSPSRASTKLASLKADLREELPQQPLNDLAAGIMERARSIDAMAAKCGSLRGDFVRLFREGSLYIQMATDALLTRGSGGSVSQPVEESPLKGRLVALQEEVTRLKAEREAQRQALPPSSVRETSRGEDGEGKGDAGEPMDVGDAPPPPRESVVPRVDPPSTANTAAQKRNRSKKRGKLPPPETPAEPPKGGQGGKKEGGQPPSEKLQPPPLLPISGEEIRRIIREEVRAVLGPIIAQETARLTSGNGARVNDPKAPLLRGGAKDRPVPETGGGKKGGKRKGAGGQGPSQSAPISSGKGKPPGGGTGSLPVGKPPVREAPTLVPQAGSSGADGLLWSKVVGRRERRAQKAAANPLKAKGPPPKTPPPSG